MFTAKLTSKGQITIPVEVRKKLGLEEGSFVTFSEQNGSVVMQNASGLYKQSAVCSTNYIADNQAVYDASNTSREDAQSVAILDVLNSLTAEQRSLLARVLLGNSFLDELETWRKDFDVKDDGVAKALDRRSKELPDHKRALKIWG